LLLASLPVYHTNAGSRGSHAATTCGTAAVFDNLITGRRYWQMNIKYNLKLSGQIWNAEKKRI